MPPPSVLLLGAGPAGAMAGLALARAGVSVVIVEKERLPRRKACGGLLSPKSVEIIEHEIGPGRIAPIALAVTTGCRIVNRGEFVAEAQRERPMYVIERSALDAMLLDAARAAGCEVIEGARAIAFDPGASEVTLEDGRRLRGRIVLGADGVNSVVRRALWGGGWPRGRIGLGLVTDLPAAALRPEMTGVMTRSMPEIHFGDVPWGYGWVFPKGDKVSIGVGGLIRRNPDMRGRLRALVERCCVDGTWQSAVVEGHLLPCGCIDRPAARGNALLLGDAAGIVEPITGEGIAPAMESGLLAAEAVRAALTRGTPEDAGAAYCDLLRRRVHPQIRQALWARHLIFPAFCQRLAMRRLGRSRRLVRMYLELLAGEITYRKYFRRMLFERT